MSQSHQPTVRYALLLPLTSRGELCFQTTRMMMMMMTMTMAAMVVMVLTRRTSRRMMRSSCISLSSFLSFWCLLPKGEKMIREGTTYFFTAFVGLQDLHVLSFESR